MWGCPNSEHCDLFLCMTEFQFKSYTVRLYVDAAEPEIAEGFSTGFAMLEDKIIRLYVGPNPDFEDVLSTVSHELGHLIEGGFRKNPPDKRRWFNRHEAKAEHYEDFALDAYRLTKVNLGH